MEILLGELGVEAEVRADWRKKPGTGNGVVWMVEFVLEEPVRAFLYGLLGAAGVDGWKRIKALVRGLYEARKPSRVADQGNVVLKDTQGTQLLLFSNLPDEAYQQLAQLDLSERDGWMLVWVDGRWIDPNREYAE